MISISRKLLVYHSNLPSITHSARAAWLDYVAGVIRFTCNPNHTEVLNEIRNGEEEMAHQRITIGIEGPIEVRAIGLKSRSYRKRAGFRGIEGVEAKKTFARASLVRISDLARDSREETACHDHPWHASPFSPGLPRPIDAGRRIQDRRVARGATTSAAVAAIWRRRYAGHAGW